MNSDRLFDELNGEPIQHNPRGMDVTSVKPSRTAGEIQCDPNIESPRYENPPVDETAIGVQFGRLIGFTNAHFGLVWKRFLESDSGWVKAQDAPYLPDQFEKFGDEIPWGMPSLSLFSHVGPARVLLIHEQDDRVIQIQNTRFLYNWRKRESIYPSFKKTYPDFLNYFERFRSFTVEAGLGELKPNQWEITYINNIAKGTVWESPEDWRRVFPGLFPQSTPLDSIRFENFSGENCFEIGERRGRLRISVHLAKMDDLQAPEILRLQLTARGPITSNDSNATFQEGIEIGHRTIVQAFERFSDPAARDYWKQV